MSFLCLWYCYCLTVLRYEEAKAKGTDNYDRELEDVIDKLIGECDRKIGRALKRLEDEDAKAAIAISVSEVTQVSVDCCVRFPLWRFVVSYTNLFCVCRPLRCLSCLRKLKRS